MIEALEIINTECFKSQSNEMCVEGALNQGDHFIPKCEDFANCMSMRQFNKDIKITNDYYDY